MGCLSSPPPRGWLSGLELLWPQGGGRQGFRSLGTPPALLLETGLCGFGACLDLCIEVRALPLQEATGSHTPALPGPAPCVTPVGALCGGCLLQTAGRPLGQIQELPK